MLLNIVIKNYALIEALNIDLDPGLNVITGETGAGKSIVIDALTLLLGQRGNKYRGCLILTETRQLPPSWPNLVLSQRMGVSF